MILPYIFLCCVFHLVSAQLRVGFYNSTCPQAETIVRQAVQNQFNSDRSITAALLRMHFHDCFVRGCDASILIKSTKSKQSERNAGPNQTVRGFELIDKIKKSIETLCPSTVSCADIITLATRDAVAIAGGPSYAIPTGRRDGLVSNAADVNLPGPSFTVPQALQSFTNKGLSLNDMVTLLGAHTVGVAHCNFFQNRLSPVPDNTMDPSLAAQLLKTCSKSTATTFLDQNTSFTVDNQFFRQIMLQKGILKIDQELTLDNSSASIVSGFASNENTFRQSFSNAMIKMASIDILVGRAGEIRKNCGVFNPPNQKGHKVF
ncbi:peroxidase 44 [Nicotiana tomentosiformis]|uniref:peroxidase 44 n=1 Tax=Nicotiana tomentosiformis TaxID=4098 RepID=UPI00051BD2F4|nr:peroxidase 44 [Nicotiana tomentosiformis]